MPEIRLSFATGSDPSATRRDQPLTKTVIIASTAISGLTF